MNNKLGYLVRLTYKHTIRNAHSNATIVTESSFANQGSWLSKKAYKYFGYSEANIFALRRATIFHYQACSDKLDYGVFFNSLKLPDTFFSYFLVTQLHVWMCQVRSMQEGYEGRTLRNEILARMWTDVQYRIKLLDALDRKDSKKVLEDLLYHHQGAMISYDEGYLTDDKGLASALWRVLYSKNEDIDYELLDMLVEYVRTQVSHLKGISSRDWCLNGRFDWMPFEPLIKPKTSQK